MKRFFAAFLILLFFLTPTALGAGKKQPKKTGGKKQKVIQKYKSWKNRKETPKMVETVDEWLEEATLLDPKSRENPKPEQKENKKLTKVKSKEAVLTKYNNPPGGREVDITMIKKYKLAYSEGIASDDFTKMAYVQYNYYPVYNQISSEVFIVPLNESLSFEDRLLNVNIVRGNRQNTLKSGKTSYMGNLFSSLTIVDWSRNGDILLLKEKIGSLHNGIFKTNICIAYVDENSTIYKKERFDFIQDKISDYWTKGTNIKLSFYRWDIKVLGWSASNDNEVIMEAHAFLESGKKADLGIWGLNCKTKEVRLISVEKIPQNISAFGNTIRFEFR